MSDIENASRQASNAPTSAETGTTDGKGKIDVIFAGRDGKDIAASIDSRTPVCDTLAGPEKTLGEVVAALLEHVGERMEPGPADPKDLGLRFDRKGFLTMKAVYSRHAPDGVSSGWLLIDMPEIGKNVLDRIDLEGIEGRREYREVLTGTRERYGMLRCVYAFKDNKVNECTTATELLDAHIGAAKDLQAMKPLPDDEKWQDQFLLEPGELERIDAAVDDSLPIADAVGKFNHLLVHEEWWTNRAKYIADIATSLDGRVHGFMVEYLVDEMRSSEIHAEDEVKAGWVVALALKTIGDKKEIDWTIAGEVIDSILSSEWDRIAELLGVDKKEVDVELEDLDIPKLAGMISASNGQNRRAI